MGEEHPLTAYSNDSLHIDRGGAGLTVASPHGPVRVDVCTPRIVRVRLAPDNRRAGPSYVLPHAWPPVACDLHTGDPTTPVTLDTGSLVMMVETDPARLVFADSAGNVLLRGVMASRTGEESDGPAPLDPLAAATGPAIDRTGSAGIQPASEGRLDAGPPSASPADTRANIVQTRQGQESGTVLHGRSRATFEPVGEQHFYGLGHGGKQFDRLGSARQLWNSHIGHGPGSDISVPLLLSNRGYGLFFDNTSDARLEVGRSDDGHGIVYSPEAGPLEWYFLVGADPRELLGEVATLLGRAPLPPRWTLGFLQSTRHFSDANEVRRLPQTLREKEIPCDGLIFLSTYGDASGWNRGVGHLEFHAELFPIADEALAAFHEQGFHVITHEYPVLHKESPLFAEAAEKGYLLAEGYEQVAPASRPTTNFQEGQRYIDFSNPSARAWWWDQHRRLAELGVDGWWLDGGEGPSSAARLQGGAGLSWHNVYDRMRQQAFAEGEAADFPRRRPFLLCRSGGAGMQRDGAACWSGDINNTFATLEAQVPLGLNTALSGIPYWGTDIGGFFHPIPESGELYARWFQFGAFCPSFRSHGWVWREHTPWAHGPEIEAICRRYAGLRYRLLPYTYTLAWQTHSRGLPFMRPLVLNYPDDPRVWDLGSEYLWGDDLLVAPVTREGATSWPAYLPAGTWYDFWTQERYDGPRGVTVDAPLDRLPLFVRAGAILPLAPIMQRSDEHRLDEITLLTYPAPGDSQRFELYEDDGQTNDYRQGGYALTGLECGGSDSAITLTVDPPRGNSSLIPQERTYVWQVLARRPQRVAMVGGDDLPERDASVDVGGGPAWWHDGTAFTFIRVPAPCTVTMEM